MELRGGGLPRPHEGPDLDPRRIQPGEDDLVAPVPPLPGHLHGTNEHGMVHVHVQAQDVQLVMILVVEFHPGDHPDPLLLACRHSLRDPGDAVVVRQGQQIDVASGGAAYDRRRRKGAVGMVAMGVQVKSVAHSFVASSFSSSVG